MKKLLLIAVLSAISAFGSACFAAEKYNIVRIERVDGVKEHLLLNEKLDIRISDAGTLMLVHPEITVEYELGEVGSISFAYALDPDLYDGDHESAINAPAAPDRLIRISDEAIIAGADDAIEAYDLKGRRIAAAKGSLDLHRLPAGSVYVIRIGSTSLKIKR